jgi:hypothetical protein
MVERLVGIVHYLCSARALHLVVFSKVGEAAIDTIIKICGECSANPNFI